MMQLSSALLLLLALTAQPASALQAMRGSSANATDSAASSNSSDQLQAPATELEAVMMRFDAALTKSGLAGKDPVPKARSRDVDYSASTCKFLFAYEHPRDACARLQKKICGRQCEDLVRGAAEPSQELEECKSVQDTICAVPQYGPTPAPVQVHDAIPPGRKAVNTTYCNARSRGPVGIWAIEKSGGVKEVVPSLEYLECAQLSSWGGHEVAVSSGESHLATIKSEETNSIVLIGQSGLNDKHAMIRQSSFKDEHYDRPILCNLAYHEYTLKVKVAGRKWYPFVIRGQAESDDPAGTLSYLQCELLALDRVDSLREQEALQLYRGDEVRAVVPVSPVKTLIVLSSEGAMGQEVLDYKSLNLGYLKY